MQYSKCQHCKYNHPQCRYVMAQAMATLWHLQDLINSSQTRKGSACQLKIDYECTAFQTKEKEE